MFTDKCPDCGAELQASAKVYFDDVVLNDAGEVVAMALSHTNDVVGGHPMAIEMELVVYCKNDHPIADPGVLSETFSAEVDWQANR